MPFCTGNSEVLGPSLAAAGDMDLEFGELGLDAMIFGLTDLIGAGDSTEEDYKALFKKIDTDGSGGIDKEEMKTALKTTAKEAGRDIMDEIVDKEVESMFKEYDVDKSGLVDEQEFVQMMTKASKAKKTSKPGSRRNSKEEA